MKFERNDIKKAFIKTDLLDGDYRIIATGHPTMQLETIKQQGIPCIVEAIEKEKNHPEAYYDAFFLVLEKVIPDKSRDIFVLKILTSMETWSYILEEGLKEDYLPYFNNSYSKSALILTLKTLEEVLNYYHVSSAEHTDWFMHEELLEYLKGFIKEK